LAPAFDISAAISHFFIDFLGYLRGLLATKGAAGFAGILDKKCKPVIGCIILYLSSKNHRGARMHNPWRNK
jgi:hypothetical protein